MQIQITVQLRGGPAQTLTAELPESAQELEEETLRLMQRTGRIVLEQGLQHVAMSPRTPCCCGQTMKNCGLRTQTLTSLMGELIIGRRR